MTHVYQSALITGASRGIGAALARSIDPGTRLILTARDAGALESLAHSLQGKGRQVDTLPADLSSDGDLDAIIQSAENAQIDLLINNAGVGDFGPFLSVNSSKHLSVVDVNVPAPLKLTHAVLPPMLERAHASRRRCGLIIIGSTAGLAPVPRLAVYAASKAMLHSWSSALTEELRDEPVDILTALPGTTRTTFGETAGFGSTPLPGARDPNDVAQEIIEALGRQHLVVTDRALAPAEMPLRLASRVITGVLGRVTDRLGD